MNSMTIRKGSVDYEVLYDDCDADIVESYRWRILETHNCLYVFTFPSLAEDKWVSKSLHRLIMKEPKGLLVDHINRNGLDNRRSNLRTCTNSQNQMNKSSSNGTSKFKGVSFHKASQKFEVRIQCNGKQSYLGLFDSEVEAAVAYDSKAVELFGVYACLNFPVLPLA